ncbi:MAG: hypothetical protein WCJ97_08255 [Phycisphaerae bacterium]
MNMAMKKKSSLQDRYNKLTPDEVKARWQGLRPRYYRWLGLFGSAAALMFLLNHAVVMPQKVVDIINVAFQICSIFFVMFAVLIAMSYIFGGVDKASKSD